MLVSLILVLALIEPRHLHCNAFVLNHCGTLTGKCLTDANDVKMYIMSTDAAAWPEAQVQGPPIWVGSLRPAWP